MSAAISSFELISRKVILWDIVEMLCQNGSISLIDRGGFQNHCDEIFTLPSATRKYGTLDAPFIATTSDALIFPETGLMMGKGGEILNRPLFPNGRGIRFVVAKLIWQLFYGRPTITYNLFRNNYRNLTEKANQFDCIVPLIPRYYDNYYHWTVETLPKIRFVREFEAITDREVTYLVPQDPPSWLSETLELVNVPETKIKYPSSNIIKAKKLVMPSFPVQTKEDYEWIVNGVMENIGQQSSKTGSNILISRSGATERRIRNQDEIMELLRPLNFELIHLEDQDVITNISQFRNADIVIGAHGAGLTDLIYCEDTCIVELFGAKVKPPYKNLADTMEIPYINLKCDPRSVDLYVEPDDILSVVNRINIG